MDKTIFDYFNGYVVIEKDSFDKLQTQYLREVQELKDNIQLLKDNNPDNILVEIIKNVPERHFIHYTEEAHTCREYKFVPKSNNDQLIEIFKEVLNEHDNTLQYFQAKYRETHANLTLKNSELKERENTIWHYKKESSRRKKTIVDLIFLCGLLILATLIGWVH